MPEPAMEAGPPRPSATAGMGADPALAMAAIMENQVEEMRKMLNKFKVCSGTTAESAGLPGHADVLIFGPSGSGKSSLIRTFYMALHKTQQVPPDFAERIIVKDTAMNEGTLKYVSAVIKPAKLDHRGNILSSSIMCHDTRGQIWMDEREQKQLSVIMDGQVKDDCMVQQRNYRYARLLWEFWKRDSELFPPEILANGKSLNNQPHAVLFVFDGSVEEIPDGEEETHFYREIIQMCRSKGYANPQEPGPPKMLGAAPEQSSDAASQDASSGPIPFARVAPRKFRILFTCKICETRNSHMISRLAYQQGIVIATCPGCSSRHLLADKTGLLDVGIWDVEQLAQQGENVTRLTTDGYQQVSGGEPSENTLKVGESPLLVRNKDGLLEALPEEDLGMSRAADFMADTADEDMVS